MRTKLIFTLILPALSFASCQKQLVAPAPLLREESGPQLKAEPSYINVPVSIPYKGIEDALEKSQGKNLYTDDSYDNNNKDGIKIKVSKKGAFDFRGYKEYIRITLPLSIWFSGRWEACDFCPAVESSTDFDANITFTSRLALNMDWKLATQTEATSFEVTRDPYIKVGPLNINARKVVEYALRENLKDLAKTIDTELQSGFDLKKHAEDTWKQLQKPMLADSAYNAWIRFAPEEFILAPIQCGKEDVTINGALLTGISTSLGAMPNVPLKPLPGITFKEKNDNAFRVELAIEIPFTEATAIARRELKDTIFPITKKKQIKIDDVEIFGKAGEVFIKVKTSGSLRSIIFLKGTPAYDDATRELYLNNFDYELQSKQALVKAASWLLKSTVRSRMAKAFRYPMDEDYAAARAAMDSYLADYTYKDLFNVKGKINSLKVKGVSSDDEKIYAVFYTDGNARVKMLNLNW